MSEIQAIRSIFLSIKLGFRAVCTYEGNFSSPQDRATCERTFDEIIDVLKSSSHDYILHLVKIEPLYLDDSSPENYQHLSRVTQTTYVFSLLLVKERNDETSILYGEPAHEDDGEPVRENDEKIIRSKRRCDLRDHLFDYIGGKGDHLKIGKLLGYFQPMDIRECNHEKCMWLEEYYDKKRMNGSYITPDFWENELLGAAANRVFNINKNGGDANLYRIDVEDHTVYGSYGANEAATLYL